MKPRVIIGSLISAALLIATCGMLAAFSGHAKIEKDSVEQLLLLVVSSGGGFLAGLIFAFTARAEVQSVTDVFLRFLKTKNAPTGIARSRTRARAA